jgi:hypothetical protein
MLASAPPYGQLPQLGMVYRVPNGSYDYLSYVSSVDPTRDDANPYHWRVEVNYDVVDDNSGGHGGKKAGPQDPQDVTDPRNWLPSIGANWILKQRPVYYDVNGNKIINSAMTAPNPPINQEVYHLQVTISRYEDKLNLPQLQQFNNVLNADTFWGQQAGMCKCLPISFEYEQLNGVDYWKKKYTIEIAPGYKVDATGAIEDWGYKLIDQGYTQLVDANGNPCGSTADPTTVHPATIPDRYGGKISQPVFLDGHGAQLAFANSTPVWVAFKNTDGPPTGQRLQRANSNSIVDGYQLFQKQYFSELKLPDITQFDI